MATLKIDLIISHVINNIQIPDGSLKTKEKSSKSLIINHYQGFLFSPNTAFHRKKQ
jgi:hypothetical protein